jgi:hypothetical protein
VGPLDLGYAFEGPLPRSKGAVRLVIVGDSDFASDDHLQLARVLPIYTEGARLLFNAIDWIAEDETLAPLRTKPAEGGQGQRGAEP